MKLLRDILYKVTLQAVHESTNLAISHVSFDSRNIKKDTLFIADKINLSFFSHKIAVAYKLKM